MEYAQSSFISSTFWTERIGPTAAIATLAEMKKLNSWDLITKIGRKVKNNWEKISKSNKINIEVGGIDALASFTFDKDHLINKTFLTKYMLNLGFLSSNLFYACTEHKNEILNEYFEKLNSCFQELSKLSKEEKIRFIGKDCISHSGFSRVN